MSRDTDFLFQKMAFSVSENLEFRFRWAEKRKFCFAIDFVHMKKLKFRLHKIFIKTWTCRVQMFY